MQLTLLPLLVLAGTISAQTSTPDLVSVLSVLQTALPSSLLQEALTNSAAASSEIASEFSVGPTPSWFVNLPSDIKSYLVPLATGGTLGNVTGGTGVAMGNGTASGGNGTSLSSSNSSSSAAGTTTGSGSTTGGSSATSGSSTTGGGGGASATTEASTTASAGGAAMPTALYGLGLVGAVGLVGVLAL